MINIDPRKQAFSLLEEFKNFAFKGNVVDLAIGVIIGAAFGKIVESLVKNIIMPFISLITPGDQAYTGWKVIVGSKEIPYGLFLGDVVNFVIVAFTLFLCVKKFLGFVLASKKEEISEPAPLTKDQELLLEIRDLLAKK